MKARRTPHFSTAIPVSYCEQLLWGLTGDRMWPLKCRDSICADGKLLLYAPTSSFARARQRFSVWAAHTLKRLYHELDLALPESWRTCSSLLLNSFDR